MSEWETYCDESYYHLWRVRRNNERNFDDGFHLQNGEEAKGLCEFLNKLETELAEVTRQRDKYFEYWESFAADRIKKHKELIKTTRQRDELKEQNRLFRNETLICADCDAVRKIEYDEAIRQRDRLAEALAKIEERYTDGCDTYEDYFDQKLWETVCRERRER